MAFIEFTVNGQKCVVTNAIPRETSLNAYLRYHLGLPGTKAMCHEGGCGACIVKVRARRPTSNVVETFSVNSCLVLVFSCNGWEVTTIEGVGNRRDGYSEIQKRLAAFNGTQCGYCSPGWTMHLTSLQDKNLTMAELEKSFGCNTCRCTGFRPILDTIKSFAVDASPDLCQRVRDIEELNIICAKTETICQRKCSSVKSLDSDWSEVNDKMIIKENNVIIFTFGDTKYYKVYSEEDVFDILRKDGTDSYMLVDGNTGKGVYENFNYPRIIIDISSVASLKHYYFDQNLVLGANISLEDCIKIFKNTAKTNGSFAYLSEFAKHFELIAHIPVRKIGSLAGNLMLKYQTPSYQSDVFLLLASVGAMITIRDSICVKTQLTLEHFLKCDMKAKIILNVELPPLSSMYKYKTYKIMPRNQNALAIVNAAFLLKMDNKDKIKEVSIVYGNISADFVHATKTERYLNGKNVMTNTVLQGALQSLNTEIVPVENPPEPSPDCRRRLAVALFYKFVLSICPSNIVSATFRSGGEIIERPVSKGTQDFQTDKSLYPLNEPVQKIEGLIQCAGEAEFANDVPNLVRQVFAAFVLSEVCVGEIDNIDATEVLKIDGVLAVYTAQDIPGKKSFTFPGIQLQTEDEEILASTKVKFNGQPVAILVAKSEELAAAAAKRVKVTYKNISSKRPVLTIDQAKRDSNRYAPNEASIKPTSKGNNVTKVIKGVYEIEAQYHYYLEPITCVAIPVDQGLEIYDSTQWMDLSQIAVAQCLGIKESDVLIKVRRLGGGFGGKISRNVQATTACALVAKKQNVPCRLILPMKTNMTIAGRRLPCQCEYEVGVDDNGIIQYLNATIVEDGGCSQNENILSYTIGGFKNCYNTDTYSVKTALVLTDLPSNTFARAPGTCEGISSIEHIMEHIAFEVHKDATDIRIANMRTDDNDLPELIKDLKTKCDYEKRFKEIQEYNKANRWMKKAIKIGVMSFPVEFYGNYNAMVSIYRGDGTVTVTTGGIEMGQGVNTKAAQVCAYKLGVPLKDVTIIPSYTFSSANCVFSGSSIVSECVCYAVIRACDILNERLEPVKKKMGGATWKEIVKQAGEEQIDLMAEFMMKDSEPDLSNYSAFTVTIMETQLDVLTGRFEILRVDILEDVGLSTNPTVDVGQVEGAFVQGLGYYTSEKFVYDKKSGKLLTNRSLKYLVPLAQDIPINFNVYFRYNSKNPKGVLGSKAVGEMGICTSHVINFTLRQCIMESRYESGYNINEWINITIPYNAESILQALDVKLEEMLISSY